MNCLTVCNPALVSPFPTHAPLESVGTICMGGLVNKDRNLLHPSWYSWLLRQWFEFMGMIIVIWPKQVEDPNEESECILLLGDNTSVVGWSFQSIILDPSLMSYDATQIMASKVGNLIMASQQCLASQHINGEQNIVSDLFPFKQLEDQEYLHLLIYDRRSDKTLTKQFHLCSFLPRFPQLLTSRPCPTKFVLGHASGARSWQIIFDSRQELVNEKQDPLWQQWPNFCSQSGVKSDPFLLTLLAQRARPHPVHLPQTLLNGLMDSQR
jgi:hypothetical protein